MLALKKKKCEIFFEQFFLHSSTYLVKKACREKCLVFAKQVSGIKQRPDETLPPISTLHVDAGRADIGPGKVGPHW